MSISGIKTLIEMLVYRAKESGEKTAFTFDGVPCTYSELWQEINLFGSYLKYHSIEPDDRVVLTIPNSREFFSAFYGIQRVGGIAVPLFPGSGIERIFSVAGLCGAKIVVVPSNLSPEQLAKYQVGAVVHGLKILTVQESLGAEVNVEFPVIRSDQVAFIQYTSGSTGNPKGVMLSHENLLDNIRQMIDGMRITKQEIFVSWLPVYHDMGLILKTMVPFYLAAQIHLLPAELRHVRTWLETIQRYRATFTAAPDFAYRLCLRMINDPESYDISSLRVALNAAEPVRWSTIEQFEQKFGLRSVMVAGYGLAEATVGVSMWETGTPARVDTHGLVSVGHPFPNVKVRIVQDGHPIPHGDTGEIVIRSKANCRGYFNNPQETENLFWKDGYLFSGDLGYLDRDGFLYIVGRKKNTIKHAGETIAAQEIEEIVDGLPYIRSSAAIGIDRGGIEGEQAYIFVEVWGKKGGTPDLEEITLQIVQAFHTHLGFRPGRVFLIEPHTIPRTYNGKIQHALLRERYLTGELRANNQIIFPDF